jgi:hypothetical protein
MTRLAEMCVSPTEPLRYIAAEFTFIFDEICSVSFAGFFPSSNCYSGTLTTYELFFLKRGVIVSGLIACFSTTIIRLITFETLIIRKSAHCEFL